MRVSVYSSDQRGREVDSERISVSVSISVLVLVLVSVFVSVYSARRSRDLEMGRAPYTKNDVDTSVQVVFFL